MRILGIETSCDETSASVIQSKQNTPYVTLLSNVTTSSLKLHAQTGGIIPEIAAREQLKYIIPVIQQALIEANVKQAGGERWGTPIERPQRKRGRRMGVEQDRTRLPASNIDAIAVTIGPGLIGSLLVGVETAKTLAYVWNKPIIPVNHLYGHIYANWINLNPKPYNPHPIRFPALALIVSGGHTDLVLMKDHGKLEWLGGTRDDAAGEAFDKIGRLLGLPYPAGPVISKLAEKGNPKSFAFPRPMIDSDDFDFSFSGLKTAVLREVKTMKQLNNETIRNLCASAQQAIVDVLIAKTLKAAQKYQVKSLLLGGGVAANEKLKEEFKLYAIRYNLSAKIFVPDKNLCTDNAAMIASAAFFNYKPVKWQTITANPELYFD